MTGGGLERSRLVALDRFLAEHVDGHVSATVSAEVAAAGRSNLTLVVTDAAATRLVVRMPPGGQHDPTAHDVCREGRIIAALAGTDVPVPDVPVICDDPDVIGSPFFVMRFVDGAVLDTADDAAVLDTDQRRHVGLDLARRLAAVHQLDPGAHDLGPLGRPGSFVDRQLRRFHRQWRVEPAAPETADFLAIHASLVERRPADVATPSVVHGDYRLGNAIVDPARGTIAAVLDWELTTLGHPTSDLAYLLNNWVAPDSIDEPVTGPTAAGGFVSRDELVDAYLAAGGPDSGPSTLAFFRAFSYWRLASLRSGVVARLSASADPTARQKAEDSRRSIPALLAAASGHLEQVPMAATPQPFEGARADAL